LLTVKRMTDADPGGEPASGVTASATLTSAPNFALDSTTEVSVPQADGDLLPLNAARRPTVGQAPPRDVDRDRPPTSLGVARLAEIPPLPHAIGDRPPADSAPRTPPVLATGEPCHGPSTVDDNIRAAIEHLPTIDCQKCSLVATCAIDGCGSSGCRESHSTSWCVNGQWDNTRSSAKIQPRIGMAVAHPARFCHLVPPSLTQ